MNTISKTAMKTIVFWARRALGIVLCLPASTALAAGPEFFEQKVRPLLADKCQSCHSEKAGKQKGGLLLDSREAILKGGESGAAASPAVPPTAGRPACHWQCVNRR